jgi:5-methylcytosine-specific restriction endonuclease McrA
MSKKNTQARFEAQRRRARAQFLGEVLKGQAVFTMDEYVKKKALQNSRRKKQKKKNSQDGFWRAYEKYVRSEKWMSFRASIIAVRGRKCEECPTVGGKLHLHHLNYNHFKSERPEDVKLLCVPCHQKKHPGRVIS